ncbi:MAG: serine/threonine protein kinase [Bradymonadia bacterium]|jgi:serine/threonine protein kinase
MSDEQKRHIGRYELLSLLGEGGAANTYQARDTESGEEYAVKELRLLKSSHAKQISLFERECAILQELDHPQIPTFIDTVVERREETISLYLVQELIRGQSLQSILDTGEYFSARETVEIMRSCLLPLRYLHERSPPLFHRDIKPANVIRRPDGSCVLVDFGAVREALLDGKSGGSSVVGTFGYMAPEQFQARAYPSTDLYGVAATALQLLTGVEPGRFPLRRLKPDIHKYLRTDAHLAAILDILLEPAAEDRYSSTLSLINALERWETTRAQDPSASIRRRAPELDGRDEEESPTVSVAPELKASLRVAPPCPGVSSDTAPRLTFGDLDALGPTLKRTELAKRPPAAHQQLAKGTKGTKTPVVTEPAPALELWVPGGQGASSGGLFFVLVGVALAAYAMLADLAYNSTSWLAIAGLFGLYGIIVAAAGRRSAGKSSVSGRVRTADAQISKIVKRVALLGSSEWVVFYSFIGPDELHYANAFRLPSGRAAKEVAMDPSRLLVKYQADDPTLAILAPRK